ncbi:MAG: sulfotransferase family protein [Thalassotalea sp.]
MISNKYQCVFVHVPKTAGQSIEHFFLNLHQLAWQDKEQLLISKNKYPANGPERLAHLKAAEYYQCGHINQALYKRYFSFAFVRNPWERLVSEYLHKKIDKKMTLKEYFLHGLPSENLFCDKYRHIMSQSDYLFDQAGNQLVTFIGRFENIQQDFDYVCQQLGIEDSTLPHKNSARGFRRLWTRRIRHIFRVNKRVKRHYSEFYDEELKQLVAIKYQKDIELFNYKFEDMMMKEQLSLDKLISA